MSPLRRLVFWILVFAIPVQAMAAPGWQCAQAGHHAKLLAAVETQAIPSHHAHDTAHGTDHRVHDAADDAGNEVPASSPAPDAGKCSACSGCCSGAAAIAPALATAVAIRTGATAVDYLSPAVGTGAGEEFFRPPRTMTL